MTLTYHAVDFVSGRRLGELAVSAPGPLKRTLGQPESISFAIQVNDLIQNPDWNICTSPGRAMICAEDDDTGQIVWDGIVWGRSHDPFTTTLSVQTTESYFTRRFVGNYLGLRSSTDEISYRTLLVQQAVKQQQSVVARTDARAVQAEKDVVNAMGEYNFQLSLAENSGDSTPETSPIVMVFYARLEDALAEQVTTLQGNQNQLTAAQDAVDQANASLAAGVLYQQNLIQKIADTGEGTDGSVGAQVTLVAGFIVDSCGDANFTIEVPPDEPYVYGQLISDDTSDTTVANKIAYYAALSQPVEWRCYARWTDGDRNQIEKVVQLSQRVGTTPPSLPAQPRVTFDQATMNTWNMSEDYSDGAGATRVRATGTIGNSGFIFGSHDDQNTADDLIAGGMPIIDYRYTPSASINTVSDLDSHAAAMLELIKNGTLTCTTTIEKSAEIKYGEDIEIGDYVQWIIDDPRWPNGIDIVQRLYSVEFDYITGTMTPVFYGANLTRA